MTSNSTGPRGRWAMLALLFAISTASAVTVPADAPSLEGVAAFERADFVQRRIVPALERPLISSGSVVLSAHGFVWEQLEPFRNTLVFDGETVIETTYVGSDQISRPLDDVATVNLTRTLFEMLSGSWDALEEAFQLSLSRTETARWTLRLVPTNADVRVMVPEITVTGERYVDQVRVLQSDGGETIIELANQRGSQ